MRIAVLTSTWNDDDWHERCVALRRVLGAMASAAEIDVFVPATNSERHEHDGALQIFRFAAPVLSATDRRAVLENTVGPEHLYWPTACDCTQRLARALAEDLPRAVQRKVAETTGPTSSELSSHLRDRGYDVVLFGGFDAAFFDHTLEDAVRQSRLILLPLARDEPSLYFSVYDPLFERADRILVFTERERCLIVNRLKGRATGRIRRVGFPVRINSLAATTSPYCSPQTSYVVLARDWRRPFGLGWLFDFADSLARKASDIELALVGPGAGSLPSVAGLVRQETLSRLDAWRWMNVAFALLDAEPNRMLGLDVLEAMLCGAPVLVPAHGGAAREHAESGNGGLWYRSDSELRACLDALRSAELRQALGRQGRHYVESEHGDVDRFIGRVRDAITA
ncbi:MAG TPA: glycosyltransferase [Candidatus Binatia bacterium]|nr:glycosyltransferase [Candidatus Binatia bacterium]